MKTNTCEILHSPDNGSTASVLLNGPLGRLYVQVLDAYGFQREMTLRETSEEQAYFGKWTLSVYQHPGRRDNAILTDAQAEKLMVRIREICAKYPHFLFNIPELSRPRCGGFVQLCEIVHRGCDANGVNGWLTNL